jgi:type VI secretion system secreted protein VgrG
VQYQETDLAFFSRLCEHEGIWYRFEQGDGGEKLLVCDSADDYGTIAGEVPFRPVIAGESEGLDRPEEIRTFESRHRMIAGEVVLNEYNWRTPGVDLQVSHAVDAKGTAGSLYLYGEHYATREEGHTIAQIRAEEVRCRRVLFSGTGDSKLFRAGRTFELADHYRGDFNRRYLLVEVEHEAAQSVEFLNKAFAGPAYRNSFVAIPANVPFRPERVTPRPRVEGVLNAQIDAAGTGEYAEIDDLGRYKVKIPFDRSGRDGGLASRYVRMAQPYVGQDMGMHFPLHKGTEVLLVHTNGDPDRPIIAGAVPNAETTSVVTAQNQTQCAIRTSGGNHMTIENTDGKQRIRMYSPTAKTKFRIGAP